MYHYLITYDLNNEKGSKIDYNKLYSVLEGMGAERLLESVWLYKNSKPYTVQDVHKHIASACALDPDDGLVVVNHQHLYMTGNTE